MNQGERTPIDAETLRRRGVSAEAFEEMYLGDDPAPWDIGRPQPVMVKLVAAELIHGEVLDVGCGTGDNALFLAEQGYRVTGVDLVPVALERARAKAGPRGVDVTFLQHDCLDLPSLNRRFDTVIDCGLFHGLSDAQRPVFVAGLAAVLNPGGYYHLLCFSEAESRPGGPRRLTQDEIRTTFSSGWTVEQIDAARFEAHIFPDGAQAWLARIRRTP